MEKFEKKDREKLISQRKTEGKIMVEEWNIKEGNFMLFMMPEEIAERPKTLEERVQILEIKITELKRN